MSFARLALRIATVKALRGRTWAGEMVRDSEIGPIDDAAQDKEIPFVVVYTDDAEGSVVATDLFGNDGKQCLVIEIGVTTRMKKTRPVPGQSPWVLTSTDAGLEMTIDGIERQIRLALGAVEDPWSELWRSIVVSIVMRKSQRGASNVGARFSGRQVVLDLALLRDPHPGRPLGPVWTKFLELCAADADLAPQVPMLTALATGGATDWNPLKVVRTAYGLSAERAAALQLAPHPAATEGTVFEAPVLDGTASVGDVGELP